jgi:GTP-binding protein HflX
MIEVAAANNEARRAFLIGIAQSNESDSEMMEQLDELAELVRNVELIPLEPEIVRLRTPHAQYMMGSGKAEEIAHLIRECEADCVVFDTALTPSQQRNWERLVQLPVADREEIILDIFARRAHTHEAVLQVALARAEYSLPRLTRAWSHFSRQRGGGATNRGQGEAQIETDRRLLKRKIQQLTEELESVRKQRTTGRKARQRRPVPQGAIVGYTNVGKSSLLQTLTGADIFVKDQLFATLDPTARKVDLGNHTELVLIDTVGFVRKLPHELVEAFKSTLESAAQADILIVVLDLSSPDIMEHWTTTMDVMASVGAGDLEKIVVFYKTDLVSSEMKLVDARQIDRNGVFISVKTGDGIEELTKRLCEFAGRQSRIVKCLLPPDRHDLAAKAHRLGCVLEQEYADDGSVLLTAQMDLAAMGDFQPFIQV